MDPRLNFIYRRRSIRKYHLSELAPEVIEELLKAAMAAPSAKNGQPWEFIVLTDSTLLAEVLERHPSGYLARDAGTLFVMLGDPDEQLAHDLSAATQNLLLAATALGLGSCWLGMREERHPPIKELLDIPAGKYLISMVAVGKPAEEQPARTQYDPAKVHWQKYGG